MNTITNLNTFPIGNSLDGVNIITEEIGTLSLLVDGTNSMLADLNMDNHIIKNMEAGIDSLDAVNKSQLDLKADTTYVNTQLALKADTTYVNTQLALKADTTYVNTQLALKADTSYVNTQDNLKVNKAGDTMTGNLTMNTNRAIVLNNTPSLGDGASLQYATNFNECILSVNSGSTTNGFDLRVSSGNPLSSSTRIWAQADGKVGINTRTPAEIFDVNGNSIIRGSLDMNLTNKIINVAMGTNNNDAVNKGQLDLKADKTYTDTQLALKADKTYTDTQLALKADKTYTDTQLALKADKTYTDTQLALKADTSYVNTQDNLKVNKAGDTMTDYLRVPEIILIGQTTTYLNNIVDVSNRTNTYITFEPAGATTDWAYLRQIGGSDDIHLSLDFHDTLGDGAFSLRSVQSTSDPDVTPNTFFYSSPTGTAINSNLNVSGVINRTAWSSGELIQTQIYNQNNSGTGIKVIGANSGATLWKSLSFTMLNNVSDSWLCVEVSAPYYMVGYGGDAVLSQVRDFTGSVEQQVCLSSGYWENNSGGGLRGGQFLPLMCSYTPDNSTDNKTRTIEIRFNNTSLNDDLIICNYRLTSSSATLYDADYYTIKISEYKK